MRPGAAGRVLMAALSGALAGIFGTALHAHGLELAGLYLLWGPAAALALVLSTSVFVALRFRSAWFAVLAGAGTYLTCGLLSIPRNGYGLIISGTAGNVWLYGIAAVAPLAALLSAWVLRGRRRG
ncbi:MAG: hypothetical protein ACHP7K_10485 [Actinomycetales bacterium]